MAHSQTVHNQLMHGQPTFKLGEDPAGLVRGDRLTDVLRGCSLADSPMSSSPSPCT